MLWHTNLNRLELDADYIFPTYHAARLKRREARTTHRKTHSGSVRTLSSLPTGGGSRMGMCQSGYAFEMPGIPGAEILDDDKFTLLLLEMEVRVKKFNSVALYTRKEMQKDVYLIEKDKWKKLKYFEKDADGSAGLLFKCNNGEWLMLELSSKGFWWMHRTGLDSKRMPQVDRFQISETHRHEVPIDYLRRLINEQRDRCYERGSLFSFSEFATTIFKQLLKRHYLEEDEAARKAMDPAKRQAVEALAASSGAEPALKKTLRGVFKPRKELGF